MKSTRDRWYDPNGLTRNVVSMVFLLQERETVEPDHFIRYSVRAEEVAYSLCR
jgi:hypothetical protein